MSSAEAGLRGGAIAILLLLALFGWRDARQAAAARYSVLFMLCGAAYLVEIVAGVGGEQRGLDPPAAPVKHHRAGGVSAFGLCDV
jgi:hypothetical protein